MPQSRTIFSSVLIRIRYKNNETQGAILRQDWNGPHHLALLFGVELAVRRYVAVQWILTKQYRY